jgi:hypothetical protein
MRLELFLKIKFNAPCQMTFPIKTPGYRLQGRSTEHGRATIGRDADGKPDIARTALARRTVQLSKEGIRDEGRLVQAGLSHLHELTLKGGQTDRS